MNKSHLMEIIKVCQAQSGYNAQGVEKALNWPGELVPGLSATTLI